MANSAWGHSDLPSGQLWKDCVTGFGDDPPGNNNRGIYICLNYYIPWLRDTPVAATFVLPSFLHPLLVLLLNSKYGSWPGEAVGIPFYAAATLSQPFSPAAAAGESRDSGCQSECDQVDIVQRGVRTPKNDRSPPPR